MLVFARSVPVIQTGQPEKQDTRGVLVSTSNPRDFERELNMATTTTTKTATAKTTQPTVTLKQIAAELADKFEMSKKSANEIVDELVTHLVKNLKKGNRIRMAGLGILQVRKRAARMGRNPATGEQIKIPAKKKIAFRAAKELKEAVGA